MYSSDVFNIIIGKESNLSCRLKKKEVSFILFSSREILLDSSLLNSYKNKKVRLIFNNFQPSTELGNITLYVKYIERAILSTSIVLDSFQPEQIVKIIYTSSSSVYGNNMFCNESDDLKVMNFHASLKIANEKMIENYCLLHSVDYSIARIFNMYGGKDKFSIISKIIKAYNNSELLTVVNNGSAIRDFIHIDNVVDIYIKLLTIRNVPILNIGKGKGSSVSNILTFLNLYESKITTKNILRDEIEVYNADIRLLKSLMNTDDFIEVESYLKESLSL